MYVYVIVVKFLEGSGADLAVARSKKVADRLVKKYQKNYNSRLDVVYAHKHHVATK